MLCISSQIFIYSNKIHSIGSEIEIGFAPSQLSVWQLDTRADSFRRDGLIDWCSLSMRWITYWSRAIPNIDPTTANWLFCFPCGLSWPPCQSSVAWPSSHLVMFVVISCVSPCWQRLYVRTARRRAQSKSWGANELPLDLLCFSAVRYPFFTSKTRFSMRFMVCNSIVWKGFIGFSINSFSRGGGGVVKFKLIETSPFFTLFFTTLFVLYIFTHQPQY